MRCIINANWLEMVAGSPWPFWIPTENSVSPRNVGFWDTTQERLRLREWVVVDAVSIEPVSGQFSLITRENTGTSWNLALVGTIE